MPQYPVVRVIEPSAPIDDGQAELGYRATYGIAPRCEFDL